MGFSNVREISVNIIGMDPGILYCREDFMWDQPPKETKETYMEYEERTYKLKAHSKDGVCILPGIWIKKSLARSQVRGNCEVPPAGRSRGSLKTQVIAGVMVSDAATIMKDGKPYPVDDLVMFKKGVSIKKDKILRIRPLLSTPWSATLKITLVDNALTEDKIRTMLDWCGFYDGLGDWRVSKGGIFGRYEVVK
jgi:hypothetical protein